MPVKPTEQLTGVSGTNVDILNRVRANNSSLYQDRIPIATQENFQKVAQELMHYAPGMNEFLPELLNKIALTVISSKSYLNELRMFKRGMLEYGEDVNEIFVHLAKAHQYNPAVAEKTVFKREIPDVSSVFHRMNYQNFWKRTIEWQELKLAFTTQYGLQDLTNRIIDSMLTSEQFDEYLIMKRQVTDSINSGQMRTVTIDDPYTTPNKDNLAIALKYASLMFSKMGNKYNPQGVLTYAPVQEQYLIMDALFAATFDVTVLAAAFNMDKVEFLGHIIVIDEFADMTGLPAVLVSRDWFMDFDNERYFDSIKNPEGLYWNYTFHAWKTFSFSPFANAVAFVTSANSVTAISTDGSPTEGTRGGTVQLTAKATGTGIPYQGLYWDLTNGSNSYVTSNGLLVIGEFEKESTLTVKITSISNPTVSTTLTVTVN
ncbi:MAG: major head protein [Podoviridae sp. ctjc_2]|nr:MAG: major head protein [Podoviridae sp. ctjc_2]